MDGYNGKYTFIDLFSGCGGMSLGFEMAGFEGLLAIDCWKDALETYSFNRKSARTLCADLSAVDPESLRREYGIDGVDVIIGGPPCQGFSIAGKRVVDDERNSLYKRFVEFVRVFGPKAFVMENVPNILNMGGGVVRDAVVGDFESLGYKVVHKVMLASDYGVPQNRRRAVFVGLKNGNEYVFPEKETEIPVTAFEALSDLPEHALADGAAYPCQPSGFYQAMMRKGSGGVFNHDITAHSQKTKDIVALVPDGGNYKDLPPDLRQTRKVHIAWTRINSRKPSFTIDTGHRHHFHYEYNRIPTVRESARIQSFPDSFVFQCSKTSQYKQVGNAVPPLLAKAIALRLKPYLEDNDDVKPEVREKKNDNSYMVPEEYFFRLHHPRPRFKNDVENVLLYVAGVCDGMSEASTKDYKNILCDAIRIYPGNEGVTDKTVQNWRTEIAALFGFYVEDKKKGVTKTGEIARFLAASGDLVQFFKFFLLKFQYPGGHIKPNFVKEMTDAGIKFKPAQYILKVLHEAEAYIGKPLGMTKAEATHCIFNDLRVTRDRRDVREVIDLITENRKKKINYESSGDVIRYAGDILDYMVLANLLKVSHNYYYINRAESEAVLFLMNGSETFDGYDKFYGNESRASDMSAVEPLWFGYVNDGLSADMFRTDLGSYIQDDGESVSYYKALLADKIEEVLLSLSTKEIGDLGEALVLGHEKMRVKEGGREDLLHLIRKIPTALGVGYDIQSVELDQRKRYIEVKTTVSNKPINFYSFHMTPNEWDTAVTLNDRYFVYRLMVSRKEMIVYILQDPVGMYKRDKINMSPRNGAEISFDVSDCVKARLLIWQD